MGAAGEIAYYSDSPAASRASARSAYAFPRTMTPSRIVYSCASCIFDRDPALLSLASDAHEDQDPLVVDVEDPLRLNLQVATPRQRVHELPQLFKPAKDRTVRVEGGEVRHEVGRNQATAGTFPDPRNGEAKVGKRPADKLHVLLRDIAYS